MNDFVQLESDEQTRDRESSARCDEMSVLVVNHCCIVLAGIRIPEYHLYVVSVVVVDDDDGGASDDGGGDYTG